MVTADQTSDEWNVEVRHWRIIIWSLSQADGGGECADWSLKEPVWAAQKNDKRMEENKHEDVSERIVELESEPAGECEVFREHRKHGSVQVSICRWCAAWRKPVRRTCRARCRRLACWRWPYTPHRCPCSERRSGTSRPPEAECSSPVTVKAPRSERRTDWACSVWVLCRYLGSPAVVRVVHEVETAVGGKIRQRSDLLAVLPLQKKTLIRPSIRFQSMVNT